MKKLATLVLFAFLSSPVLLTNCSSDTEVDTGVAPEIPPLNTFVMDFAIADANDGGRIAAKSNWTFSVLNVAFWNTAITLTYVVPVASFAESFNHTPTFDPEIPGWVWEYDYTLLGTEYHAKLQAEISTSAVEWNMFITNDGVFTDFNWYSGTSALDGLSGQWILNQDPEDPKPFIQTDWNRSLSGDVADIKYTNITPDNENNGSSIFFQIDSSVDFDRAYDIFSKPQDNTTKIEWNSSSKNGRVMDLLHFQDEEYHCWDEMLEDIDCPS